MGSLIARPQVEERNSLAVLSPQREPLFYGRLAQIIQESLEKFRNAGIGAQDRVAVVLPNGPEMAVALLAAMTAAAAAPLNPNYSSKEFDFYLTDLEVKALLIQAGMGNPSREVARARQIPIIDLSPDTSAEGGSFRLDCPVIGPPSRDGLPRPDDFALLLPTSGTTSNPKLVPLRQSNLYFSALNIKESLRLSPEDRCLNVMPLFHIHGLASALLASLAAGGSVICAPGFLANEFFSWINDLRPTWYTAVPTMHQAILRHARDARDVLATHRLRFIRSCSAPLSPSLMSGLENLFRVPVVEAYGMTEASHQMACNPLPPRPRKRGSVGLPTGVKLAILDEAGGLLPAGKTGEVGVRGETVILAYLKSEEGTAGAFSNGWFRTGDLGYFDADGYLYLRGRLKELINRGGEKVSPREVEDVLMTHPAIAQAVAFAVPDKRLGEDIAAAVVLRTGAEAEETEIRAYAAENIAFFKVPRRIIFVNEISTGPTGKPQRSGLAKRLGLSTGMMPAMVTKMPRQRSSERITDTEKEMLRLLGKSLGSECLGVDDNFFEVGGDSLQAAAFLEEVGRHFGIDIPLASFSLDPTIRRISNIIKGGVASASAALVPIKQSGSRPPFFCVHPHDGRAALYYQLAQYLEKDQPFYAFQAWRGEDVRPKPGGIERLAERYVKAMQALRPEGPYLIGGYCFGALVAFEMARILSRQKKGVAFLALIDGYAPGCPVPSSHGLFQGLFFSFLDQARRLRPLLAYISQFPPQRKRQYLSHLAKTQAMRWRIVTNEKTRLRTSSYALPGGENDKDWQFRPPLYLGSAVLFRPTREPLGFKKTPDMGWSRFINANLNLEYIKGYHRSLIFKPHLRLLTERLNFHLKKALEPV